MRVHIYIYIYIHTYIHHSVLVCLLRRALRRVGVTRRTVRWTHVSFAIRFYMLSYISLYMSICFHVFRCISMYFCILPAGCFAGVILPRRAPCRGLPSTDRGARRGRIGGGEAHRIGARGGYTTTIIYKQMLSKFKQITKYKNNKRTR